MPSDSVPSDRTVRYGAVTVTGVLPGPAAPSGWPGHVGRSLSDSVARPRSDPTPLRRRAAAARHHVTTVLRRPAAVPGRYRGRTVRHGGAAAPVTVRPGTRADRVRSCTVRQGRAAAARRRAAPGRIRECAADRRTARCQCHRGPGVVPVPRPRVCTSHGVC
eukprot:301849-Hanusia_phi.AAC.1